jgi:glycosyltransferase involved in cell wall biosynthesis
LSRSRKDAAALLPGIGGSLGALERHGQLNRLLDYYFPAYLELFNRLVFFSYEPEQIEQFTEDATLRSRVDVFAPRRRLPRHVRAAGLTAGPSSRALRRVSVARAFQAPGGFPPAAQGVPLVCTYGYDYLALSRAGVPGRRAALHQGLRFVLRRASATIVTSEFAESQARELGAQRIVRIPNGVDLELFSGTRKEPTHDLAFVGQLIAAKDVPTLLRAAARLDPAPRIAIVGDGPELPTLRALAESLGVSVEFLGVLPNERVADVLSRTRCFVLPSRTEGQPKALLESLAAGTPSVGSDIPAIRELAREDAVILFPPGDEAALATAVRRVLDDTSLQRELARRGRELVETRFDLRRLVVTDAELLREVAA